MLDRSQEKAHLRDRVTENDPTNQKTNWLLSYPVHNTQCVQPDKLYATVCTFVLLTCNCIKNNTTMRCLVGKNTYYQPKASLTRNPKR